VSIPKEPILAYVLRNLESARGTWPAICEECGVPYSTLFKIAQGQIKNPRINTVQRLVNYFGTRRAHQASRRLHTKAA